MSQTVSILIEENTPSTNAYGGNTEDWDTVATVSGRIGNRNAAPGMIASADGDLPYRKPQYIAFDKPFSPTLPDNVQNLRFTVETKQYRAVDRTDYEKSVQFLVERVS